MLEVMIYEVGLYFCSFCFVFSFFFWGRVKTSISFLIRRMQLMGFIKSNDHQPTHHRPTDNRQPTHQPTDPIILFRRFGNRKIFILHNTHTAENIISVYYLLYLMNNICLYSFKRLQKKTWLLIKYIRRN